MAHQLKLGLPAVTKVPSDFLDEYLSKPLVSHLPYVPGDQPLSSEKVIKLNTNENPFPPTPALAQLIASECSKLNLYPNPKSTIVRDAVANLHGLSPDQVIVGNGSDDLLNLCVRCFADYEYSVGMLEPSYSLYEVLASIQGAKLIRIPFQSDNFDLPLESIHNCGANIFFIASPHAPSGRSYNLETLGNLIKGYKGMVVIDEAYVDFSQKNAIPLLQSHKNLIITRTLSKSYSLAGLRVGFALAHPKTIEVLDQAREVYNLDRLAQVGAVCALEDQKYFQDTTAKIIRIRNDLAQTFVSWGWKVIPSETNFLFVRPNLENQLYGPEIANSLFCFLKKNNILVRYFPDNELTHSYLRISIGKPDDMTMLVNVIQEWQIQEKQK